MRAWSIMIPLLAALACAAGEARVLMVDSFESASVGARPGPWLHFVDPGNSVEAVAQPAVGARSLKLTRGGGTIWMPMVAGHVAGEPDSVLRFEFDACVAALSDRWDEALTGLLRADGNVALVEVSLGGPGGVAVPAGENGEPLPLDFPLKPGEFARVTVVADPLSRGPEATFDLTVTQGEERLSVPNIPFRRRASYPATWWYSPTFHIGGGSPSRPREAWVDNVKITALPAVGAAGPTP